MEDGFAAPPEPVTEDGDMTRLVLQHCVMPAYQFIIQVEPDQTSVTHLTFLIVCLIFCVVFVNVTPATPLRLGLFLCTM